MLKKFTVFLFLSLFIISTLNASSEDKIKSMYIGRFSMFFKWPIKSDTFNMCIYNDSKFAKILKKEYKNRLPNGSALNVIAIKVGGLSNIGEKCHILYSRNSSIRKNIFLLDDFDKTNVLLISDEYDDINHGAMVSFYLKDNKIRFVINQKKLLDSGLNVSYKLLKYAKVVNPVDRDYVK